MLAIGSADDSSRHQFNSVLCV